MILPVMMLVVGRWVAIIMWIHGKSLQARPAAEMDDMRTEAWLLAVELSDAIASPERRTPPWHIWN